MPRIRIALATLALALAVAGTAAAASINLVAYSTPKTVMGKIIDAWNQTPDGKDVSFSQSYGASTDQAKAVAAGLNADVVFLSTGDDVIHASFGEGVVTGVEPGGVIVVSFEGGEERKLMADYAPLKKAS